MPSVWNFVGVDARTALTAYVFHVSTASGGTTAGLCVVADARALLRQLLGCRARPTLAGGALSGAATSEVGLDEVARHALERYGERTAPETSERLNFARPGEIGSTRGRAPPRPGRSPRRA